MFLFYLRPRRLKGLSLSLIVLSTLLILLILGRSSLLAASSSDLPAGQKPNVLLITIDTLRADRLSCYGSQRPLTPNIDRLAFRGALFRLAVAHTPTTLPSHANILLGTTPVYHGVHDNLNFVVADDFLTLAEYLQKNGYETGAFVGAYLLDHRFGLSQGFKTYDDNYSRPHGQKLANLERPAEEVVGRAMDWLRDRQAPWFLWIHCYDPHDPYDPPEPFKTNYAQDPYNGEVAYVDASLKPLLELVETDRLRDSTIVIFTADHGEALGEHGEETHGFLAYNSTLWVPLIIVGPGIKPQEIFKLVSHVDLFPTICELLSLPKPESLQGLSLVPLLEKKRLPSRQIYFESLYPYYNRGWAPIRGFYQESLKFIDSPIPELYDIKKDFAERQNLIRSGTVAKYKAQLSSLMADLTGTQAQAGATKADRERLEKLRSLGYVSSQPTANTEVFGPEYDVKTLLPFNNQAVMAIVLYQQGEKEKAIKILEDIIKQCPQLDNAYSNLAIIYERENKLLKAIETLELGLARLPSSYEFFFNCLNLYLNAGKIDEALEFFAKRSPQFPRAVTDPEVLNLIGLAYAQKGELKKAIEIYQTALAQDSRYAPLLSNLATAYYSLFLQTRERQAWQNAMEKYKQAIEVDPNYAQPYHGLGMIYRVSGNLEGAIFCWEKALELNPELDPAYYSLGQAYMEKGDYKKALAALRVYQKRRGQSLSSEEKNRLASLIKACEEKLKER